MTARLDPQEVAARLSGAVPGAVRAIDGDAVVVHSAQLQAAVRFLAADPDLDLVFLANLTAVDREDHFEVVYHLQSLDRNHLLSLKTIADDHEHPRVPTLTEAYVGATLQERELYDLMGITFDGHPDLRRIFLWEGFAGHPLRKDFLSMPQGHTAGLPGFPHESGANAWPVPGSAGWNAARAAEGAPEGAAGAGEPRT